MNDRYLSGTVRGVMEHWDHYRWGLKRGYGVWGVQSGKEKVWETNFPISPGTRLTCKSCGPLKILENIQLSLKEWQTPSKTNQCFCFHKSVENNIPFPSSAVSNTGQIFSHYSINLESVELQGISSPTVPHNCIKRENKTSVPKA